MEFNEKLQQLRKHRGLTQEELAEVLYVSRTAVSKWESGRGYPSIDSLKAIAKFFDISIDALLSGGEILRIAEEDNKEKTGHFCDMVFGLLDISMALFLFLPFFRQESGELVLAVPLFTLAGVAPWLKAVYIALVLVTAFWGVLTLALQNCKRAFWLMTKSRISLALSGLAVLSFIVSMQPYAAAFLFLFLAIKAAVFIKRR